MDLNEITKRISAIIPKYLYFIAEKDGNCCEQCRRFDGKVFCEDDKMKPKLPLHPNCRCSWRPATIQESLLALVPVKMTSAPPAFVNEKVEEVIKKSNMYTISRYQNLHA